MAQKFTREYPVGSKEFARIMQAHPSLKFTLRRLMWPAVALLGGASITTMAIAGHKALTGQ